MRAERSETPSVLGKRPPLARLESCEDTLVVSKRARSINTKRVQWASPGQPPTDGSAKDQSREELLVALAKDQRKESEGKQAAGGAGPARLTEASAAASTSSRLSPAAPMPSPSAVLTCTASPPAARTVWTRL